MNFQCSLQNHPFSFWLISSFHYFSYPRTESTAYPSSFDFKGTLVALVHNPAFGGYAQKLLTESYNKPRAGTDAGDHPPITPMRSASEDSLGNDAWKLYQYICQHFLGTLSPDCKYRRLNFYFLMDVFVTPLALGLSYISFKLIHDFG